jgi:hypothetical protein
LGLTLTLQSPVKQLYPANRAVPRVATPVSWVAGSLVLNCGNCGPGTDVMILKIFSPKKFAKKMAFLLKTKLNYAKI